MTHVGKYITVLVCFGFSGRVRPIRFKWSERLVRIEEITYTWKSKDGKRDIYHFSVTDGNALYELTFDNESLTWRLENIEA